MEDVCTPQAWENDPARVLEFYDRRRADVKTAEPNAAHRAIAELESKHDVTVITQNIDDLHERAGSTNVIHLHGEIFKVRSERNESVILDWRDDVPLGAVGPDGAQLRPHIVFFGEGVLRTVEAWDVAESADVFLVCGTSLQVQPAASLIDWTRAPVAYLVDPNPARERRRHGPLTVIAKTAGEGVPLVVEQLLAEG